MGKLERKIRQSIRREASADFQRIKTNIARHRPWWCPDFVWVRVVNAVLNSSTRLISKSKGQDPING